MQAWPRTLQRDQGDVVCCALNRTSLHPERGILPRGDQPLPLNSGSGWHLSELTRGRQRSMHEPAKPGELS
eukprot:452104-Rhodomonas_salina.4